MDAPLAPFLFAAGPVFFKQKRRKISEKRACPTLLLAIFVVLRHCDIYRDVSTSNKWVYPNSKYCTSTRKESTLMEKAPARIKQFRGLETEEHIVQDRPQLQLESIRRVPKGAQALRMHWSCQNLRRKVCSHSFLRCTVIKLFIDYVRLGPFAR